MAPEAVKTWLIRKRRLAVAWAGLYASLALGAGLVALLLTSGCVFLAAKLMLLLLFPEAPLVNFWSGAIALLVTAVISLDGARASREDMSLFPLWLIREYVCLGPRAILDGWHNARRAWSLARIEIDPVAKILTQLAARKGAASREEFSRALPGMVWSRIAPQLRLIDGVIVFWEDESRVTLTWPLRLELSQLAGLGAPVYASGQAAEPIPVNAPEKLSAREILGVSPTASLAEIRTAYRNRVKECHPDRFTGMDEHSRRLAEDWTKALNAAYEELATERGGRKLKR